MIVSLKLDLVFGVTKSANRPSTTLKERLTTIQHFASFGINTSKAVRPKTPVASASLSQSVWPCSSAHLANCGLHARLEVNGPSSQHCTFQSKSASADSFSNVAEHLTCGHLILPGSIPSQKICEKHIIRQPLCSEKQASETSMRSGPKGLYLLGLNLSSDLIAEGFPRFAADVDLAGPRAAHHIWSKLSSLSSENLYTDRSLEPDCLSNNVGDQGGNVALSTTHQNDQSLLLKASNSGP
ncbi:unnamed protein product, partial [Protopolystoma xenopodis]